jgi:hypothetical protein
MFRVGGRVAGIETSFGGDTFRATGITACLETIDAEIWRTLNAASVITTRPAHS